MSAGTPRGDEQEEIGRLLAALPAVEPPRATLRKTEAALERARGRGRASMLGKLALVAAGALATVGITFLGRELDATRSGPTLAASTSTVDEAQRVSEHQVYRLEDERGRYDYNAATGEEAGEAAAFARGERWTLGGVGSGDVAGQQDPGDGLGWNRDIDAGKHTVVLEKEGYFVADRTIGGEPELPEGVTLRQIYMLQSRGEVVAAYEAAQLDGEADEKDDDKGVDATGKEGGKAFAVDLGRGEDGRPSDGKLTGLKGQGTRSDVDQGSASVDVPDFETTVAGNTRTPPAVSGVLDGKDDRFWGGREGEEETRAWRHDVAALTFIPASGWFANTYRPGDRDLALLRRSLTRGLYRGGERVRLDELAAAPARTQKGPSDRAIGLQVTSDVTAVEGPTRMTVQVSLSGAERGPTQRAPVALALVVDLGAIVNDPDRRLLWSVAEQVAAARQAGDRVFIVVPVGGRKAEVLRDETVTAGGAARFLAAKVEALGATRLEPEDLRAAVSWAYAEVAAVGGEADAVLATRAVVLATTRPARDVELEEEVRKRALEGIELSTIATGATADAEVAGQLAGVGLGRRWVVAEAGDAARVVAGELAAAGSAVARAVRLQLKLAPGVKLVEVLGSRPLTIADRKLAEKIERELEEERQRYASIPIDDARAKPEDGIQISIPSFMSNDQHVILLDVVVAGPGPVIDVRARYKDLVRMDNGETQAALEVGAGASQTTPLTLEVTANRDAYETARALLETARYVGANDVARAVGALVQRRSELVARGAAGVADATLVGAYIEVLGGISGDEALMGHVARSLSLSAAIRSGHR